MLLHALNPFGFAWLRRVNEEIEHVHVDQLELRNTGEARRLIVRENDITVLCKDEDGFSGIFDERTIAFLR